MRERLPLRFPRVFEEGPAGRDRRLQVLATVAREAGRAELLQENLPAGIEIEVPLGELGHRETGKRRVLGDALRREDFCRADAPQLGGKNVRDDLRDPQIAAGEIEPRQADRAFRAGKGEQDVVGFLLEQLRVGEGPRRDDARHLPVDRPLGGGGIADLLADRHRFADAHELREVLVHRVVGHARHLDRRARRGAARGERDVEQPRGALGVVVEQLVEVAHAVEQQDVGVLRL